MCGKPAPRKIQQLYSIGILCGSEAYTVNKTVLGVPILTLTGHYEVNIENYRGILEYTEQLIRINVRSGQIRITGKSLEINYYTTTDMKITGKVEKIEYS